VESSKRSNDLQDSVCDSESYVAQRERRLEHNFHPKITKFLLLRDIQRPTVALIVKPATESSRKNTDPTHPLELQIPIPTSYPLRRPGFVAVGARRPIPRLSSSRLVASIITPPPFAFTPAPSSPTPHEASVPSLQSTARPALRMLVSGSIRRQAQLELEPGRGRARSRQP
jgi:hypothetical protein